MEDARNLAEDAVAAKSDFLANMSHEIRTPMNAILGLTDIVLRTDLSSQQYKYLKKVDMSAKSLLRIINDILDFSKIDAGKLDIENIEFKLDDTLDHLAGLLAVKSKGKDELEILYDIDSEIPRSLIGDPLRLSQILINLSDNAVKFTNSGEVVVSAKLNRIENEKVLLNFSIKDSGIGLTKEQMNKLFNSFEQADTSTTRKYGGTGLGLSICKKLVELMGGKISVDSEIGKGTTFTFTVQFSQKNSGNIVQEEKNSSIDLRSTKTLIVDDHKVSREILAKTLNSFKFKIKTVDSGLEAISEIESADKQDPYELVLMDWKIPFMNETEAITQIKNNSNIVNKPKIIIASAYGREDIIEQGKKVGADGFILKPSSNSTIYDSIVECFYRDSNVKRYEKRDHKEEDLIVVKGADILLVEDNEINQEVANEQLKRMHVNIDIANNGKEAVDAVRRKKYDLILNGCTNAYHGWI